jgi:hypothetical protein
MARPVSRGETIVRCQLDLARGERRARCEGACQPDAGVDERRRIERAKTRGRHVARFAADVARHPGTAREGRRARVQSQARGKARVRLGTGGGLTRGSHQGVRVVEGTVKSNCGSRYCDAYSLRQGRHI